ncbi:MAG: alpha/beta fold hydrolase [Humibacillus sp.]
MPSVPTEAATVPALHTLGIGAAGPRIAFLHGLFGQGRNWTQIAKAVSGAEGADARCLLVDLPDHGRSPWSAAFSLQAYADAVAATLVGHGPGEQWVVVGHSLGGKVAMLLALRHPELVARLVVVDIAPKDYGSLDRFAGYIAEMQDLSLAALTSRADAESRFQEPDAGVKAFLLQNLRRDGQAWRWQVNLDLIARDAALGAGSLIAGWPADASALAPYLGPVLWIAGGQSPYITREDGEAMRALFPRTRLFTVKGAAHWVHTDAPEVIVAALRRFVREDETVTGGGDPSPTP